MQELTYENILGETITFCNTAPYYLYKIDGIGSTEAEITSKSANIFDGDIFSHATKRPRIIDLTFHLGNPKYTKVQALYSERRKLQSVLGLAKSFDRQSGKMAKITYKNDAGTYITYGIPTLGLRFDERVHDRFNPNIKVSFRCFSAYWLGSEHTVSLGEQMSEAFYLPFEFNIQFATNSNITTLHNVGSTQTPLEIWIYGNGEKPKLENLSTSSTLVFTREVLPGECLYIRTAEKDLRCEIVKDGVTTSAFDYLHPDTPLTQFQLKIGENNIAYRATSEISGTKTILKWQDLYEGA